MLKAWWIPRTCSCLVGVRDVGGAGISVLKEIEGVGCVSGSAEVDGDGDDIG